MIESLITLALLVLLQAVLGFDNLLYISLESKRVPAERQAFVRRMGIGLAVGFRIILLFVIVSVVDKFKEPLFHLAFGPEKPAALHSGETTTVHGWIDGTFNLHAIIVLFGGAFILYTAVKEIFHMMNLEDLHEQENAKGASVGKTIAVIVAMNLVFSFDSILSAMALADNNFTLMAIAILIGGALMIWLADKVANFLQKNRLYEVLGLFILFIVGIMLLTEGGHLAHLHLAGNPITPMTKTTFYFVIAVLLLTDVVQGRYQKKLLAKRTRATGAKA
jgi:predicted tellurium resistance membrane protein TerC